MFNSEVNEKPEKPVDLREYLYLLRAWGWLILLAGLLAGVAAYLVSIRMTPIYETSMRLLISDPPINRSLDTSSMISNGQAMTSTYAEMILDAPVLQGVIGRLNLPMSSVELKPTISVDNVGNTQLLTVTVRNPNPQLAANIANTLASVFTDRIRELQTQRYASTEKGLTQQVTEMENQVNDTTAAIVAETDPAQKLQLEARLTQYRSLYSNLVTNYEQVRLAEAQTTTNVFVSEPAQVSFIPVSPKTTINTLLAALAGIFLTMVSIFTIERLDDTIKNPDEISSRFKIPVLGMITSHKIITGKPICQSEPRSPVAESFRSLRTNLNYASVDTPLKRILVTSPEPQNGKTTISSNLAVSMAQGGKSVVLVDADLRRPQIHRSFGLLNQIGLSDLLVLPADAINEALQSCDVPQLSIITSGRMPPNPAELLTSQKMVQDLDGLTQDHDLILVDTPPILSVTDAAALATQMDGILLVIKPGETKSGSLEQALKQLKAVNARVLGVILNEVDPRSRRYGYYYHHYYSEDSYYYDPVEIKKLKIRKSPKKA